MQLHRVIFADIAVLCQLLTIVEEYFEGVLKDERLLEVAGKIGMIYNHVAAGLKQLRGVHLEGGFFVLVVLVEGLLCNKRIGMVGFLLPVHEAAVALDAFLFATFVVALFNTFELATRASGGVSNVGAVALGP